MHAALAHGTLVERRETQGITEGPFPADTIFLRAKAGKLDGIVTMYHDQGQIATKLLGFDVGCRRLSGRS